MKTLLTAVTKSREESPHEVLVEQVYCGHCGMNQFEIYQMTGLNGVVHMHFQCIACGKYHCNGECQAVFGDSV